MLVAAALAQGICPPTFGASVRGSYKRTSVLAFLHLSHVIYQWRQ